MVKQLLLKQNQLLLTHLNDAKKFKKYITILTCCKVVTKFFKI